MSEIFTPGQAVTLTGIPGSTMRRYVNTFSDYLSLPARRKRGREFTERDILVLVQIRDLFKDGKSLDDVIQLMLEIAETIPDEISTEEASPTALMVLTRFAERQESQQDQINDLRDQLAQLQEETRKPWYKRIF